LGSSVADPVIEIVQTGTFGTVAVAFATQFSVLPTRVPLADPETATLPRHVALNVPDPDVPEICVTVHLKLIHASFSEPDAPGSDCVVDQAPLSCVEVDDEGPVVLVEISKQAALAQAAIIVRKMMVWRFMAVLSTPL
jgi:hypothetical protein